MSHEFSHGMLGTSELYPALCTLQDMQSAATCSVCHSHQQPASNHQGCSLPLSNHLCMSAFTQATVPSTHPHICQLLFIQQVSRWPAQVIIKGIIHVSHEQGNVCLVARPAGRTVTGHECQTVNCNCQLRHPRPLPMYLLVRIPTCQWPIHCVRINYTLVPSCICLYKEVPECA